MKMPDETLAELIREAIKRNKRVYLQPIEVSVTDGVVTLDGAVRSYRRKISAYEIASSFEGCNDVLNKLTIDPEKSFPDKEVVKNIVNALNASADITEGTVDVKVVDGIASLSGVVKDGWECLVAEDVARSVKGVRDIKNLLEIDPILEVYSEELSKGIMTAFDHTRGLKWAKIEVEINGRTVLLSGTVSLLFKKETAETVVRRFGIKDIKNNIVVKP